MNQSPLNILSPEWGWDNIRRDVFQLVAWGYQRKEKEIRQHNLEEDITGLFRPISALMALLLLSTMPS